MVYSLLPPQTQRNQGSLVCDRVLMAIEHLIMRVAKVTCQDCGNHILVEKWRDATKHGWACPSDGHYQKCPTCQEEFLAALTLPFSDVINNEREEANREGDASSNESGEK